MIHWYTHTYLLKLTKNRHLITRGINKQPERDGAEPSRNPLRNTTKEP